MVEQMPLEQVVTEFYEVYKKDKDAGRCLVKDYCRHFDLRQVDLILESLRTLAVNYNSEAGLFSRVKLSIFVLVCIGFVANYYGFGNNSIINMILVFTAIVPIWDARSYAKKSTANTLFADVVDSEMVFFREVCKQKEKKEIDSLLGVREDTSRLFD